MISGGFVLGGQPLRPFTTKEAVGARPNRRAARNRRLYRSRVARKNLSAHLAKRIQFPHTRNQCWIWTGTMSNGSGYTRVDGVKMTARRAVYRELVGEPVSALYPTCEVAECVNPRHMAIKIGRQKPRTKTGAQPWKAAGAR